MPTRNIALLIAKFFAIIFLSLFSNSVFAQEISYDKPREDLLFIQELKDVEEEKAAPEKLSDLFKFSPKISNQIIADLNFDDNYRSTSRKDEYNELQNVTRLITKFDLNKHFFIRSFIKLSEASQASEDARRNASPQGSGDRSFENLGLNLQEFVVGYKKDHFGIVAGKFNLNFGTVWQKGFGIWYSGIATQYRQREKLGTRINYNFGDSKKYGSSVFTISTFTNDRKNFDNSLITKRDSASKNAGTPGDTRSLLDSYCASFNYKIDFNKAEQLTYHFSYINLGVNKKSSPITSFKIADQKGIATALNYRNRITENLTFEGFAEYAEIKNLNGNSDISEKYLTTTISAKIYNKFNVILARANQRNFQSTTNGFNRTLTEISGGYSFEKDSLFNGLFLQIGHKYQQTNSVTSTDKRSTNGVMAIYSKEI